MIDHEKEIEFSFGYQGDHVTSETEELIKKTTLESVGPYKTLKLEETPHGHIINVTLSFDRRPGVTYNEDTRVTKAEEIRACMAVGIPVVNRILPKRK